MTTTVLPPTRLREPARVQADEEHRHRRRQQDQPGLGDRCTEAVSGCGRCLDELGQEREDGVHPDADQQSDQVVRPHGTLAIIARSISGVAARRSACTHAPIEHDGKRSADRRPCPSPSPIPVPGSAPPAARRASPDSSTAGTQLMRPGAAHRRFRDEEVRGDRRTDRQDHRQPEQPVIVQRVHDRSCNDDARTGADGSQATPTHRPRRTPCRAGTRRG